MDTQELLIKLKKSINKEAIRFMVSNNLIDEVLKEFYLGSRIEKIDLSNEDKQNALNSFMINKNIINVEGLEDLRIKSGWSEKYMEYKIHKPFKINILAQKLYKEKALIHFNKIKKNLDSVIYSLIRTKKRDIALELYLRIESNEEDFSSLAEKYSEGSEKLTRGIIGPVNTSRVNLNIIKQLNPSNKGNLVEPFKVDDWWVIVRLEHYIETEYTNILRQQLCNQLFQEDLDHEIIKSNLLLKEFLNGKE